MSKLAKLKAKYQLGDGAKYEPRVGCKYCDGTGERVDRDGDTVFCICLFVSHDMVDIAAQTLAETARKLRKESMQ